MPKKPKKSMNHEIDLLIRQYEIACNFLERRHGKDGFQALSEEFIIKDETGLFGTYPEDIEVKNWYFQTLALLDTIFGKTDSFSRRFRRIEGDITIDDKAFLNAQFNTHASGDILREGIKLLEKAIQYYEAKAEYSSKEKMDKPVKIKGVNMSVDNELYDVALSYASEDRDYVEKVANQLRKSDIKFFFDKYEEVALWGKELPIILQEIYKKRTKAVVIFLSKQYSEKVYPRFEFRAALEKAIKSDKEFILPARFDNTELPGLSSSIVYIDLREKTPEEFAAIIIQKVKSDVPQIKEQVIGMKKPELLSSQLPPSRVLSLGGHLELTPIDKYVLKVSCERALQDNVPLFVNTSEILTISQKEGYSDEEIKDSIKFLDECGYIEAEIVLSGDIPMFKVLPVTIEKYCDQFIEGYDDMVNSVVLSIIERRKYSNFDIANDTKLKLSLVTHILQYFSSFGTIRTVTTLDGKVKVNPSYLTVLKRSLK